ncbi:hypothetical protein DIJ64_07115 [Mycobacterium leprae]|uniref:Uncharacterized protein n=1 Tax=Mycobacterium leprae TaxID=1769 RepID=A0AAD0KVB8_MYCLR|nr:hypothetical protein DIJ64_07115 [Mycobacterium leprae]
MSVTIANQPKTVTASSNSTIQQVLYAPGNDQPIACLKTGQDPEHLTDEDGTKCDPQIAPECTYYDADKRACHAPHSKRRRHDTSRCFRKLVIDTAL